MVKVTNQIQKLVKTQEMCGDFIFSVKKILMVNVDMKELFDIIIDRLQDPNHFQL